MNDIANILSDLEESNLSVKDGLHYGAHIALYDPQANLSHSKALLHFHRGDLPIKYIIRWNRVAVANNKSAIVAILSDNGYSYMSTRRINNRNC